MTQSNNTLGGICSGIWVPLITPFHQDGSIDFPSLQALARHLVNSGISGLIVCATTGEAASLDADEQLAVLDAVLEAVPGHPVGMGLSGNNMASLLTQQARIQQRPISNLLVPPPSYIRPSQAGLITFFQTLADAASAPIILYNIPYRTGVAIELETFRTLARHDRIVAVKDCGGDAALTMQLLADRQLAIMAGEDQQIFSTLCLGGSGIIATSVHLFPERFVSVFQLLREQRLEEARTIFFGLLPLIRMLFAEPNPAPLKTALALQGHIHAGLRAPMQGASAALRDVLQQELLRLRK